MTVPVLSGLLVAVVLSTQTTAPASVSEVRAREVTWGDLPAAVQQGVERIGIGRAEFDAWRARVRATNAVRLRAGNFDHLVHYALLSARITPLAPIEPALSAKAFIEGLSAEERKRVLSGGSAVASVPDSRVPADARARLDAMAAALARPSHDARLTHFREVVAAELASSNAGTGPAGAALDAKRIQTLLRREYVRAMRFLYEKEFVAERAADSPAAVATLYQSRGHSSDTEIEAGYAVYVALATLAELEPQRRIGRVLIVGPGLDLAPRTGLLEDADPQSYQPFAVADALLALGLSGAGSRGAAATSRTSKGATSKGSTSTGARSSAVAETDDRVLHIDAVDLNPHVAGTIRRAIRAPGLRLHLTSGIPDNDRTRLTEDYRDYLAALGRAISIGPQETQAKIARTTDGHLHKTIAIAPEAQAMIAAHQLDIVTQRLTGAPYDLIIVTNVFPYLTDAELLVAIANVTASLAPNGVLIHNERRPLLLSAATTIGLPAVQARSVLIANVPGGRDLYDTVWTHRRATPSPPRPPSPPGGR